MAEHQHQQSSPPLLRPKPRRPFELSGSSESSNPPTPRISLDTSYDSKDGTQADISRNHSIMNLTSPTLYGIYQPTALGEQPSEPQTPWGTGAETPSRNGSIDGMNLSTRGGRDNTIAELEARLLKTSRRHRRNIVPRSPDRLLYAPHHAPRRPWYTVLANTFLRIAVLFLFGVAYGALVAHLHDHGQLAPVKVDAIDRAGWRYLAFWGFSGVGIGSLLPWVDFVWEKGFKDEDERDEDVSEQEERRKRGLPVEWHDVVRSVGAFAGIAFAIRKLSWSSTLQLSVTLALANPFLWYLLDRTGTGFTLSSIIGFVGTGVLFAINPDVIPSPAAAHTLNNGTGAPKSYFSTSIPKTGQLNPGGLEALLNSESVGIVTWIGSVLFCSCVCFGNIGRLLVSETGGNRR